MHTTPARPPRPSMQEERPVAQAFSLFAEAIMTYRVPTMLPQAPAARFMCALVRKAGHGVSVGRLSWQFMLMAG
jgi:hypothetical protein